MKPVERRLRDLFECARFLEEMGGSRDNHQSFRAGELRQGRFIHADHRTIFAPDEQ